MIADVKLLASDNWNDTLTLLFAIYHCVYIFAFDLWCFNSPSNGYLHRNKTTGFIVIYHEKGGDKLAVANHCRIQVPLETLFLGGWFFY